MIVQILWLKSDQENEMKIYYLPSQEILLAGPFFSPILNINIDTFACHHYNHIDWVWHFQH